MSAPVSLTPTKCLAVPISESTEPPVSDAARLTRSLANGYFADSKCRGYCSEYHME